MELPPHPERTDDDQSASDINWVSVLVVTVVFVLVAGLVILHLTGVVGPAGN